jgi:hypothetical protein
MDFDGDGRSDLVLSDLTNKLSLVKLVFTTSVQDESENKPDEFVLAQNYPNPFNPSTRISYYLPQRTHVTLSVYNTLGQLVETPVNDEQDMGVREVLFDAGKLSSGNYYYRLTAGGVTRTKMMTVVK